MDLGVSSPQIDDPGRGFSFMHDGPLRYAYESRSILDARHIVNHYEETQLVEIFKEYGEERFCKKNCRKYLQNKSI